MKVYRWVAIALALLTVMGCDAETPVVSNGEPRPTLGSAFTRAEPTPQSSAANTASGQPTIASAFRNDVPTPSIPDPVAVTRSSATASASATPRNPVTEKIIFDDALDPNWTLDNSKDTRIDPKSALHVKSGKNAIAVTPLSDFGMLYFTVRPDAKENYPRANLWGVSVWLNGGDYAIGPEDLALAVIGSNGSKFWIARDQSVKLDQNYFFSDTRLYYLGVTRVVPVNTWVELVLPLSILVYDPDYKYVTGLYLKNDVAFRNTYYIDRVALLMLK